MSGLAISTVLFDGYEMAVAFEEIGAAGLNLVEPAFIEGYTDFTEASFAESAAKALASRAAAAGLAMGAVSAHMDLGQPGEAAEAMLARRIRFAAACQCPVLITNAGQVRDADVIVRRLEAALPLCEELGVMLALENPGHGSGAAIHDAASGVAFLARLDHPLLRLNYDAGNVYSYSGGRLQPGDDLAMANTTRIGHLHLKDLSASGEDWAFCAIGEGLVDFRAVLRRLPSDLPMSLELPLRLARPKRGDPVRQSEPLPLPTLRKALRESLTNLAAMRGVHSD